MLSEYQYYEFLALDRPLTNDEYEQVRALSTRAQISRTHFINEYQWGDFKGDPDALMDRFYDAHLYFANWGTRILLLRLPLSLLDLHTAQAYCNDSTVFTRRSGKNVIVDLRSEDEEGEEWWEDDGPGSLSVLVNLRAELAAGDLRPLYLAWLASLGAVETPWLDEDADLLEPPVPRGLGALTPAQHALVDFLRVDRDLLAAAAAGSQAADASQVESDSNALEAWISGLTTKQRNEALRRLLSYGDPHARTDLRRAALGTPSMRDGGPRRLVASLYQSAAAYADDRQNARRKHEAKQREERAEQARRDQERRLAALAERGERAWQDVNALIAAKSANSYDSAVRLLADLDALGRRGGDPDDFTRRLTALRSTHQRKSAFIARLDRAGLD